MVEVLVVLATSTFYWPPWPCKPIVKVFLQQFHRVVTLGKFKNFEANRVTLLKFCFFGHNFWTRNTRKLIEGSRYSDYNLVSTENLSQKIDFWHWRLGPGDLSQKCVNLSPVWCHPQKNKTQNVPIFKNQN